MHVDKTVSESGKQRQNMCIQNSKGGPVLTLKIPFRSSSKIKSGHALLQPRLTHKISKEYLFSNSCVSNQCFNELRIRQTLKSRFSVWQRKLSNCKSTKVILRPQGAAVSLQQEGSHQEQGDMPAPISHQITAHSRGQVCLIFPGTSGSLHVGNMLVL